MARKRKKINKIALLIMGGVVVLAGVIVGSYFWRPIRDHFFPKDAAAIEKRADESYEAGEYIEAVGRYERAAYWYKQTGKLDARDRAIFKQARAEHYVAVRSPDLTKTVRKEYFERATNRLRTLLRGSPKHVDAQRFLCEIAWNQAVRGRQSGAEPWVEIVRECTKLLDIEANDHEGHFRRGYANARLAQVQLGDEPRAQYLAMAETDLRQAVSIKKDAPTYWMELARFMQWRRQSGEAEKAFRNGMVANPESAQLAVMYSIFLRGEDRSDQALRVLQQAIRRQPNETLIYIALASFYKVEGDVEEALKILEAAKAIDDTDFRIYGTMATIFAESGEPRKIVQVLRAGLAAIDRSSQTQPATTGPAKGQKRLENAKLQLTVMLANALLDMVDARVKDRDKLLIEAEGHFVQIEKLAPTSPARAKVAGRIALAKGDMTTAVRLLEEAYKGYRVLDTKTVSLLVSLYLRQGLRGKAEEILDRILRVRRNAATLVLKAALLAEYRQYDKAKEALRDALRIDSQDPEARNLLLALLAVDRGGPLPEALKPTRRSVRLLLNRAAEMMLQPDQRQQAVELIEGLYKKAPTDRLVIARLVNVYMAEGEADKAKTVLQDAIKAEPDKARADVFRSMLERIGTKPEERFQMLMDKADEIEDKLQRALVKATICATARRGKQWLEQIKIAEAIDPKDARVIVQWFRYALSARDWKMAEDCIAKAKAGNLDGCGGRLYAADVAIARGNITQAVAELEEALKSRPDMRRARVMLGQCYLRMDKVQEARVAFASVAKDDPGYAPAAIGMAMVTQTRGGPEHTDWVNRAYRLAPTNPYVRERYYLLTEEQSNPEDVIKRREEVLRLTPGNMQNRLRLGALYERTNRLREAEGTYSAIFRSNFGTRRFRAGVLAGFYARQKRLGEVDSIYNAMLANVTDTAEKIAIYVEYGWLLVGHSPTLPIAAFTKAIELDPKDPRGHLALGQYLARQRQWLKATEALDRYLKLRPADRVTERRLVGYLIDAKQLDRAARRLEKLIAADASDAIALTLKAVLLMRQGDMKAAEKIFTRVITENPNYGAARINRAQLYLFQGKHAKAKSDLQAAARLTNDPGVLMQLGRFYVSFQDLDGAQLVFQDILGRYERYTPAIDGLVGVYMMQKSWARLELLLDRAKKAYPRGTRYFLFEYQMWRVREDMSRAVAAASEAFKLAPESPREVSTYLLGLLLDKQYKKVLEVSQPYTEKKGFASWVAAIRAHSLVKLKQSDEAEKLFADALRGAGTGEMPLIVQQVREAYGLKDAIVKLTGWLVVRPKNWDIRLLLGRLHVQANQAQEAVEMYQKAFELADEPSQKAEAKALMGSVYHRVGQFPEAEKLYLEALKFAPNRAVTSNDLAYLYVNDMKQAAKALPYAERAVKQMPNNPNVLDTYGWVLATLGEHAKAERFLNRALQMGKATAPNLYHLGWVHEKTGRVTQATMRYQQALKLLTDSKDDRLRKVVTEALERLKKPAAGRSG